VGARLAVALLDVVLELVNLGIFARLGAQGCENTRVVRTQAPRVQPEKCGFVGFRPVERIAATGSRALSMAIAVSIRAQEHTSAFASFRPRVFEHEYFCSLAHPDHRFGLTRHVHAADVEKLHEIFDRMLGREQSGYVFNCHWNSMLTTTMPAAVAGEPSLSHHGVQWEVRRSASHSE
jgi:hypothetical protein